jgi:hypothetical protein
MEEYLAGEAFSNVVTADIKLVMVRQLGAAQTTPCRVHAAVTLCLFCCLSDGCQRKNLAGLAFAIINSLPFLSSLAYRWPGGQAGVASAHGCSCIKGAVDHM